MYLAPKVVIVALTIATLSAEIQKLNDPSNPGFVGWPTTTDQAATKWALALRAYFAQAGAPPPSPLSALIMDPATLDGAKAAFETAMAGVLGAGGIVGAAALDAGLAAFAAAIVLARNAPPATVVTPPQPAGGPPMATVLAPLIAIVTAGGVVGYAQAADAAATGIDTWFRTGTVTVQGVGSSNWG